MGTVRIMSDSTCDLSSELIEKHGIVIVPLYVVFEEKAYKDGIEMSTEELYKKVEELDTLPKTSAPSPADFQNIFRQYIEKGEDIVYIGLSSEMSSTMQNAMIAAQEFPEGRIELVDSRNLSTGIGLLVVKAAEYAEQGMSASEIAARVRELVPRVRTRFIINTLDYLYKGGRCNALESFIGNLFKIKPVVTVKDGKMILEEKIRGKWEKARSNMLENALSDKGNMLDDRIFVTHSMAPKDAALLRESLLKEIPEAEILMTDAGCVISSHCGAGTVGILYIKKE